MATMAKQRTAVTAPPRRSMEGISWSAWIWVGPALLLIGLFFIYPMIGTIVTSLENTDTLGNVTGFAGLKWYKDIFTDSSNLIVLRNNLLWLVVGTTLTVGLGLVVAVLVDRVKIERVIKSTLFIPMALSFVAAGVIWRFVYIYEPAGQPQIGLLNAFLGLFHIPPQAWFVNEPINNFAFIAIYVWMHTGFSLVVLTLVILPVMYINIRRIRAEGGLR